MAVCGSLHHAIERVAFKRIAELKIVVEQGVTLVDAAIHVDAERAALEAVAAKRRAIKNRWRRYGSE